MYMNCNENKFVSSIVRLFVRIVPFRPVCWNNKNEAEKRQEKKY